MTVAMAQQDAHSPDFIRRRAARGHACFVEVVGTELISLHEGNITHYRLHSDEYLK